MNKDIKEIINKLNEVMENIEIYYNICNNIINNYNIKNRNYQILKNMKEVINIDSIEDINNLTTDKNINNKFSKIIDMYNKMEFEAEKNKFEIVKVNDIIFNEYEKENNAQINEIKNNAERK